MAAHAKNMPGSLPNGMFPIIMASILKWQQTIINKFQLEIILCCMYCSIVVHEIFDYYLSKKKVPAKGIYINSVLHASWFS